MVASDWSLGLISSESTLTSQRWCTSKMPRKGFEGKGVYISKAEGIFLWLYKGLRWESVWAKHRDDYFYFLKTGKSPFDTPGAWKGLTFHTRLLKELEQGEWQSSSFLSQGKNRNSEPPHLRESAWFESQKLQFSPLFTGQDFHRICCLVKWKLQPTMTAAFWVFRQPS